MPGRREFLRRSAAAGAAALSGAAGCQAVERALAERVGAGIPPRVTPPSGETIDEFHHLLDRAGFGPWPGEVESARAQGWNEWLEAQLAPATIEDPVADLRTFGIEAPRLPADLALELRPYALETQMVDYTVLRATYSRRQLQEVMVQLWTDHFNIAIGKDACRWLLPSHDRDVIRRHALGNFRDLLGAVATSPAMLVYLDGRHNKITHPDDVPNENHARELLELHTMGVFGGYEQDDVMAAAHVLTGWTVDEKWRPGQVDFRAGRHDERPCTVVGLQLEGDGREALENLLDHLVAHPSTARTVCTKLVRALVGDPLPEALVADAAEVFRAQQGELRPVLRTILGSEAMRDPARRGTRLKRPFRHVVSTLRATGGWTVPGRDLRLALERMGQLPFAHPSPDGYPREPEPWLGTFVWRWRFALALLRDEVDGARVDLPRLSSALSDAGLDPVRGMARHLFGREPTPGEFAAAWAVLEARDPAHAIALLLSSPRFAMH